jgi:hypothetical protein
MRPPITGVAALGPAEISFGAEFCPHRVGQIVGRIEIPSGVSSRGQLRQEGLAAIYHQTAIVQDDTVVIAILA